MMHCLSLGARPYDSLGLGLSCMGEVQRRELSFLSVCYSTVTQ